MRKLGILFCAAIAVCGCFRFLCRTARSPRRIFGNLPSGWRGENGGCREYSCSEFRWLRGFLPRLGLIRRFDAKPTFVVGSRVFAPLVPNFGFEKGVGVEQHHGGDQFTHRTVSLRGHFTGWCPASAFQRASSPLRRSCLPGRRRLFVCRARPECRGRRHRTARRLYRHGARNWNRHRRNPW